MTRAVALLVLGVLTLAGVSARAEHQVDSRYVVLGFVTDARGHAVSGHELELVRDKTGFSYLTATDTTGFFLIVARLGDESAGEALTLKVGRAVTRLTAIFDPANHRDARGTRVDLEGATFVDRSALFHATLVNALDTTR